MRLRPTARVIVLDPEWRVLLFRFEFKTGPVAGTVFWATPGGEVDKGESYEDGAKRELFEETGWDVRDRELGAPVTEREFPLVLPNGETVHAIEKLFVAYTSDNLRIDRSNHTELERSFLAEHKWWHPDEIEDSNEKIYPEDLASIIRALRLAFEQTRL